jgi:hypothetical protein
VLDLYFYASLHHEMKPKKAVNLRNIKPRDRFRRNAIVFPFPPNFPSPSPSKVYCIDFQSNVIFNEYYKGYKLCWKCANRFVIHPHWVKDINNTHVVNYDELLKTIIEENLLK